MARRSKDSSEPGLFGQFPEENEPRPTRAGSGRSPIPALQPPERRALGSALPAWLHLGTSSWSFPGWRGIVWNDREQEATLARSGLAAYAQHPLLRCVGVDRTYYRPVDADTFRRMAAQVPAHFRFLVKAHEALTRPAAAPAMRAHAPELLFDHAYARDAVVAPAVDGLGAHLGPLLFQLSPMGIRGAGDAEAFIRRLGAFLGQLPAGPLYAVEARDRALLRASWSAMLRDTGAVHCFNAHPSQVSPQMQARVVDPASQRALVCRWMLHSGQSYEGAVDRYAPFNEIVDEDTASRGQFARLCVDASCPVRPAFVIINNKAEGSAPHSAERLAKEILERIAAAGTPAVRAERPFDTNPTQEKHA